MPRRNRYKYVLPELPATYSGCSEASVWIPAAWIPLLAGHLAKLEQRHEWASRDDWLDGYQIIAEIEECLIMGCTGTGIQVMIDEQRRLYRLLDTVLNGTVYTTETEGWGSLGGGDSGSWDDGGSSSGVWGGGGGSSGSWGSTPEGDITPIPGDDENAYVISPPLPPVPPDYSVVPPVAPGLRARVERLEHLLDNAFNGRTWPTDVQNPTAPPLTDDVDLRERIRKLQGVINAGWFGIGGEDATIADVVNALRVGSSGQATDLGDWLRDILTGATGVVSIADFLQDFLNNSAGTIAEGGTLAVLLGASVASAAMMGAQAQQIDRLIASLDGGADPRPTDNVLMALRGTTVASEARNVIDAATGTVIAGKLDTLIEEVTKINDGPADLGELLAKLEAIRTLLV